jgi:hypothetical protein
VSRKRVSKLEESPATDWTAGKPGAALQGHGIESGIFSFPGPGEQRALDRIPQRELGQVEAAIHLPGKDWIPVRLSDFSSIGFGAFYENPGPLSEPVPTLGAQDSETSTAQPARERLALSEGDEVELRIRIRSHQEFLVWCRVRNVGPWKDGIKLGLRRLDVGFPEAVDLERRSAFRLSVSPTLALRARIRHPFLYGHWCPLIASDVSRNLGLSFISTDPAILLFEGMELEIHFEIAAFRQNPLIGRVAWVHATRSDEVRFGVECMEMDFPLHNAICDFLLFSQSWSPARLRQAGFQPRQVRSHLRFGTVKTMDDYAEVLYLRRDAFAGPGKSSEAAAPERMSSPLDGRSRILMARHHGKLVGTMTFTFPAFEDTVLDTQTGFPGGKYPVMMPPKANLIEVARLCIDEEYRGTDLLQGMFEHGLKHFLMSDRHWLVTSTTDELLPVFERIGFVRAGAAYKHPLFNLKEHHLILAHRNAFLLGWGINLMAWNSVFGDLVRYLMDRKLVDIPRWMRPIIKAKLLFRPLARRFTDAKARRAFRKHLAALRGRVSAVEATAVETTGVEATTAGDAVSGEAATGDPKAGVS